MEPRNTHSQSWTSIPKELLEQITEVLYENFSKHANTGQFTATGQIYKTELLLSVGYQENGRLRQNNFEVSIDYDHKKDNLMQMIHLALDCGASLLDQFLNGEDFSEFPKYWEKHEVAGRDVYVQTSGTNDDLERQADALLGEEKDQLVNQGDEELKEQVIHMLGLNGNDEEETH